jgi:hypothetical protein
MASLVGGEDLNIRRRWRLGHIQEKVKPSKMISLSGIIDLESA